MRSVSVDELKKSLEECLDAVRGGEEVVVTEGSRPVARLLKAEASDEGRADERLRRLADRGLVRLPNSPRHSALSDLPNDAGPSGVLDALLDERRNGR